MNYPLISEYVEAIKAAEDNFEQLKHLRPVLGEDGEPVISSGNFAVVFKMKDEQTGKLHAVKCFLKEQEGRAEAYRQIAEELEFVSSTFLTPIKYLDKELFVDSSNSEDSEFPVLLMDWVEGQTLDKYIREHIDDQYELSLLAYQFSRLAMWLMPQPFAHGDLKPDNILVKEDGTLVLVDYDGMYVPAMKGQKARELGSPDFRHPGRTEEVFDDHIDDFSLASILLSLKAIALQPSLLEEYGASDRLLFSEKDYRNLSESSALGALQPLMQDAELASLYSLYILALSQNNLSQVSFRLFNLSRPDRSQYEEENLSTEVTEEDLANAWTDEYGVMYSADRKRLLKAPRQLEYYAIRKGIKVICHEAFQWCLKITTLTIPDGTLAIGSLAFTHCESLKKVIIPESVLTIEDYAFAECSSLENISIPQSLLRLGKNPFTGCHKLIKCVCKSKDYLVSDGILYTCDMKTIISCFSSNRYINIPKSVTHIEDNAFARCESLFNVFLPETVVKIGAAAFMGSSIVSITLPNSIANIENHAFAGCKSLTQIKIPSNVPELKLATFLGCTSIENIIIPAFIKQIDGYSFANCKSLHTITILNSDIEIDEDAFNGCDSLVKIIIPFGSKHKFEKWFPYKMNILVEQDEEENLSTEVTDEDLANAWTDEYEVKYSADRKRLLKAPIEIVDYSIRKGTKVVCDNAFCKTSLKTIRIPDNVVAIGRLAFSGCEVLESIIIPNSIVSIGGGAFSGCINLTSILIPKSVIYFPSEDPFTGLKTTALFAGCNKLSKIIVEDGNPLFDSRNNCNAIIDSKSNILIAGCKNTIIPESVISIGVEAFSVCTGLITIHLPDTITGIDNGAFKGCISMNEIIFPNSLKIIKGGAFFGCSSLSRVVIPKSVIEIHSFAFMRCSGLNIVVLLNPNVSIGPAVFTDCKLLSRIYIPKGSINRFKELFLENWNADHNDFGRLLFEQDNRWRVKETRPFSPDEIAAVARAEVVPSQYGNSVCFFMNGGGQTYIPLLGTSSLTVGDSVDLKTAKLVTLCREGKDDIYRVIE